MANYNLESNEGIIFKNEAAFHPIGNKNGNLGELILTNLNIIYIKKGVFGGTKEVIKLPLSQIKIINGNPQVLLGKRRNGTYQIEIHFYNSYECFYFNTFGKKELIKWIDKIWEILTGNPSNIDSEDRNYIPGISEFADNIKNSIEVFKEAFGKKEKVEKISTNCTSCGAPIFGDKGSIVTCKYCGIKQNIK